MFDVEDLETFVEVADAGGVSAAARRLGVAKSIVSRRLARLESELGAQLLARTTRGAALTEAGATFKEHAVRICAELEAARETILPSGELRGRLRLAAPLSFATHVAPAIAELARRNPLLNVHTCYADTFVDLVAGGFDAAIRVGYLADSSLIAKRIGPVPGHLVASPQYLEKHGTPQSAKDLSDHESLLQGTEPWRFTVDGRTITVRPTGRFKADNGVALAAAAVAGLGIRRRPRIDGPEHRQRLLFSGKL